MNRAMPRVVRHRIWPSCILFLAILVSWSAPAAQVLQDGGLKMEVITAYNLVVDSNVETPASYSPRSAYLGVTITNTGATTLTNVIVKMGDLTDPGTGAGTPGVYPTTTVLQSAGWGYWGDSSLKQEGGAVDATRYISSLAPGESTVIYWLVSYKLLDDNGKTVTGATNLTTDDLQLFYDVWVQAADTSDLVDGTRRVYDERHVTCRNEISAAANKIWPNTTSKVPNQYLLAIQEALGWYPGTTPRIPGALLTKGIWYDFGNVGAGFDNDGDLIPDRNAWMQPVGDPALFDATALRLVKAYGIVIVTLNDGTEQLIPFEDQLYFEHIAANNTGAVGLVFYEFMPLRSGASGTLTPYQEVASGYNNEKFNGDYGASFGTDTAPDPTVSIDKQGPETVTAGGTITYTMDITNTSATTAFGDPDLGLPAAVSDAIPANTTYVQGSAAATVVPPGNSVQIRYSTDGTTWTTTQPTPPPAITHLQWWFSAPLQPLATARVTFQVTAPNSGTQVINTAGAGYDGLTPLVTDSVTTSIIGIYSISGLVYKDDGTGTGGISGDGIKNGTEGTSPAICGSIDVTLYVDVNGNGVADSGDVVRAATTSDTGNGTWSFANLPNANYVVQVTRADLDRPWGWELSTVDKFAVTINNASQSGFEFGFAPTLSLTKSLVGSSPVLEGSLVSYTINITDLLKPSGWTSSQVNTRDMWLTTASGTFTNPTFAQGATTGDYATTATKDQNLIGVNPIDPPTADQTTIQHVEAVIELNTSALFSGDDSLTVAVVKQGTTVGTYILSGNAINEFITTTGAVSVNVTALGWTWAQLNDPTTGLTLTRGAKNSPPTLSVDRFGFRVTTGAYDTNSGNPFWCDSTTTIKVGHADGTALEMLMPSLSTTPTTVAFDNVNNRMYLGYVDGHIESRTPDGTIVNASVVTGGGTINGLDVDPVNNYVYWTTTSDVYRKPIDSGSNTVIATGSKINGVALDVAGGKVFWIDAAANSTVIKRANLDGSSPVTLVDTGLYPSGNSNPKDIELALTVGKIYFTDQHTAGDFLGVCNLDGTNPQKLITAGITTPKGLGIDTVNGKLWWSDANGIKSATLAGASVTVVFPNLSPTGLEVPNYAVDTVGTYDPNKTLAIVPLVDDYDQTKMTYVSASITPNTVDAVNGLLTWTNVGPINPAMSKTITVTFRATSASLPDGNGNATSIPNTASTTNPKLSNGDPANDATSTVNVDITATAKIGDLVWRDGVTYGVVDGTDVGLPGVVVNLYASDGTTLLESTTTDASGNYLFTDKVADIYVVKIDTTTLPTGFTARYDADGTGTANQSTVTIAGGTSPVDNLAQDFGYSFTTGIVYGNVWHDYNPNDGTRKTTDSGLGGVTVELRDGTNAIIYTTTTAADGSYRFANVAAADYYVNVLTSTLPTIPPGTWTQTADPDATKDNRTPTGSLLTVAAGGIYGAYDFGYALAGTGSIGDEVFYDWDKDNVKDAGEEGIPSITMSLYLDLNANGVWDAGVDAPVATTATDINGIYGFSNLPAGRYFVLVDQADPQFPASVTGSTSNPGTGLLYTGTVLTNVDFGYYPFGVGSISGTVWHDVNGNQVQSGIGETGIANITVTLQVDLNGDNTWVNLQTTSTDSSGNYSFSNLGYLTYRVVVSATDPDMPKDSTDAFYDATTATQYDKTLTAGSPTATANFGFNALPSIGDFVFWDANNNGTQDAGETGIAGVTVELYLDTDGNGTPDGSAIATRTTADGLTPGIPKGFYQFANLTPSQVGQYYVVNVVTAMYQTADPDRDGEGRNSTVPGLPPFDNMDTQIFLGNVSYTGADFGYLPSGVIGDRVWLDQDADGVQDAGEAGIAGVTVQAVGGTTVTAITDNDGYYSFANLADGIWTVSLPASNFASGGPLENRVATYDADGTGTPNSTAVTLSGGSVTVPAGKGSLDIDFGLKLNGNYSISGGVCIHDTRTLGICDDIDNFLDDGLDLDVGPLDETELAGLTVYLYTDTGTYLGLATTDAHGQYSFPGLPNGNYKVVLDSTPSPLNHATLHIPSSLPTGVTAITPSPADASPNTNPTSVASSVTISGASIVHVDYAFASDVDYDFGDLPNAYEATTWANDGARHIIPAGGATIYLGAAKPDAEANGQPTAFADGDDLHGSTPDDEDGVVPLNIGSWADGTNGGSVQVTVPNGVTGYLVGWIDFNHNNSLIDLTSGTSENIISQAITGTGLPQTITFNIPSGTIGATEESWLARFRIFADAPDYPLFAYKGEATNGEVEDYLFQRLIGGAIGDRVWSDTDGDGVQDANEPGLGGVLVTLSGDASRTQTTSDGTTDVDGDGIIDPVGYYRFPGLAAGNYTVSISKPTGYNYGFDENGGGDGSTAVTLAANAQHLTADFGLNPPTISGSVFYDINHNDTINVGTDTGISGVTVQLWTDPNGDGDPADGVQIAQAYTNGAGAYSFPGTAPGTYVIVESDPAGAVSDADTDGANDNRIRVNLTSSSSTGNNFLDDGLTLRAISGTVYRDANNNSAIDTSTDTQVFGVTVQLYLDADGNGALDTGTDPLVATTTTAGVGAYSFASLPPGAYLVKETDPVNWTSVLDTDNLNPPATATDNTIAVTLTAAADSTGNNFLDQGPPATAVTVAEFAAGLVDGVPLIEWRTVSEVRTLGFNLYEADASGAGTRLVNQELIPSGGLRSGSLYVVPDRLVQPGLATRYLLEEIEERGGRHVYGPFNVVVPINEALGIDPDAGGIPRRSVAAAAAVGAASGPEERMRIGVETPGLRYLSATALAKALGVKASRITTALPRGQVRLSCGGKPVGYVPVAGGAGLYFYGEASASPYTQENVYWVALAAAGVTPTVTSGANPAPVAGGFTTEVLRVEQDLRALLDVGGTPGEVLWVWRTVVPQSPSLRNFRGGFTLTGLAATGGQAAIVVKLIGGSDSAAPADHAAELYVNGQLAGNVSWDGKTVYEARITFPAAWLAEGYNELMVRGISQPGVAASQFHVDAFDVTYPRVCLARGGLLEFSSDAGPVITIDGFSAAGIAVVDITNPQKPGSVSGFTIQPSAAGFSASFMPVAPGHRYVAFLASAVPPAQGRGVSLKPVRTRSIKANYVVIVPEALASAAQRLVTLRAAQGLNPRVITFEAICDEFNDGRHEPEAIRRFLSYAWANWKMAPQYVVLAGSGSYDYRNHLNYGDCLLPTPMVWTEFGYAASDVSYGDVAGADGLPEIAVGRLPAMTPEQLKTAVDRIVAYEASRSLAWLYDAAFLSDVPDASGDFPADCAALAAMLSPSASVVQISLGDTDLATARAALQNAFQDGSRLMVYLGHAGFDRLTRAGLLTATDIPPLTNAPRFPVLVAGTCITGDYSTPGRDCLGEQLLAPAGGGCIAVWSPSVLAHHEESRLLLEAFLRSSQTRGVRRLGDVAREAIIGYERLMPIESDTGRIYNLLGDPATLLGKQDQRGKVLKASK